MVTKRDHEDLEMALASIIRLIENYFNTIDQRSKGLPLPLPLPIPLKLEDPIVDLQVNGSMFGPSCPRISSILEENHSKKIE